MSEHPLSGELSYPKQCHRGLLNIRRRYTEGNYRQEGKTKVTYSSLLPGAEHY